MFIMNLNISSNRLLPAIEIRILIGSLNFAMPNRRIAEEGNSLKYYDNNVAILTKVRTHA